MQQGTMGYGVFVTIANGIVYLIRSSLSLCMSEILSNFELFMEHAVGRPEYWHRSH